MTKITARPWLVGALSGVLNPPRQVGAIGKDY
jgi:hypothetical protein